MKVIERIITLLDQKGLKASELSRHLGICQSTVSTWKQRSINPPVDYINSIAEFLGVSIEYLITGKEQALSYIESDLEQELLNLFRQLPERQQYEFIGRIKTELEYARQ